MKTDRELNYRLYIQRSDGFLRSPFESELGFYRAIQSGDVIEVEKRFDSIKNKFLDGKGTLSPDPVRNLMYHFVTSVALVSRFCIEGGMDHDTAYTLSDIYIQKADAMRDINELIMFFREMEVDFAERMKALRKNNIDYIYEHLHEKITVEILADYVGLNPSYLSKLFSTEKGISIHAFVTQARITTAENLLINTDFSNLEIALALGFSSQSSFISVFRKKNGITPKKYRELHYLDVIK